MTQWGDPRFQPQQPMAPPFYQAPLPAPPEVMVAAQQTLNMAIAGIFFPVFGMFLAIGAMVHANRIQRAWPAVGKAGTASAVAVVAMLVQVAVIAVILLAIASAMDSPPETTFP